MPRHGCQCFTNTLSFNLQNSCKEKATFLFLFFFLIDGEMKMRDWTIFEKVFCTME